jgi:energy-coupling factor transport system permease protein
MNRKAADYFHPSVTFFYALSLALIAMLFFNPVFIVLGLFFAVIQNFMINGSKQLLKQLTWGLPFCFIIALFNPIISHGGKTLLFYFWGNPVTLEATFYGICSGAMLLLVFLWFGIYNRIVTPDRFMYLFSRVVPAASMLVTMTQRMVPLFSQRLSVIHTTQKTLLQGLPISCELHPKEKNIINRFSVRQQIMRLKTSMSKVLNELSILLSWSMEEGLDTADSMKARGYGITRRSSFSIYRFTRRDFLSLVFIAACDFCCTAAYFSSVSFRFFPRIHMSSINVGCIVSVAAYVLLAATLPLAEAHFVIMWKWSERGILGEVTAFNADR